MVASLTDESRESECGMAIWGQSSEAKQINRGSILLFIEYYSAPESHLSLFLAV